MQPSMVNPAESFENSTQLNRLRHTGTYFTGSKLAHRLVNPFKPKLHDVTAGS